MKKLIIVLMLLTLISPVFARTVQCVKKYQVYDSHKITIDVTPYIQNMINCGWKVVSITPITMYTNGANPTDYVIVVFEMEEHK